MNNRWKWLFGFALTIFVGTSARLAHAQHVGGHVGVALPFATFSSQTTTIADSTTIAAPLGLGIAITEKLKFDFETIVLTTVSPEPSRGLIVDPGLIYDWGHFATGLRVAFQVTQGANIGCIPLINVPVLKTEKATWFAEAAFPTFYADHKGSMSTVLHTGVGF